MGAGAPMERSAHGPEPRPLGAGTGALWWHDLPRRYRSYQTCHRRFQQWQRSFRLDRLPTRLAEDLRNGGKLDLKEAFFDATFAGAKGGALPLALPAVVKGAGLWRSATAMVFLSPCTWPALRRMSPTSTGASSRPSRRA